MSSFSEIVKRHSIKRVNKSAVVFGGTSGIGHGTALSLAGANVTVTIVGRDKIRGNEIVAQLKNLSPLNHEFVPCDASLLSNVAEFSKVYASSHEKLDYLVLSQGIATMDGFSPTTEGLDKKLAIHYYGRMACIETLLPLLKAAKDDARVLSVLSGGVNGMYPDYKKSPDLKDTYGLQNAADAAGMYNDLGLQSYSKENPDVTFVHSAPGLVNTNWGTDLPWYARWTARAALCLAGRSLEDCGQYMTCALLDEEYKGGFHIMSKDAVKMKPNPKYFNEDARTAVWEHTKEVLSKFISPKKDEEDEKKG